MAIITLPAGLLAGQFSMGQKRYDIPEVSDSTGHVSARPMGPSRWRASLSSPNKAAEAQSRLWQAMLLQLRGKVNHLALHDLARPAPLGTLRGSLTLAAAVAAGAGSIQITGGAGQAGKTALLGDWFQIGTGLGSQLVQSTSDATANGAGTLTINVEPVVRVAFGSGVSVTWDKALAYFKNLAEPPNWNYDPGWMTKSGYALDLLEQWQ